MRSGWLNTKLGTKLGPCRPHTYHETDSKASGLFDVGKNHQSLFIKFDSGNNSRLPTGPSHYLSRCVTLKHISANG